MIIAQDRGPQTKTRRPPSGEWRLDVIKTAAEGRGITDAVLTAMAAAGHPKRDQFAVELAMEEAVANALKHGNRSAPDKWVTVLAQVDDEQVVVEVEDEGAGFDPLSVPDPCVGPYLERPGGRGLLLMYRYMSWVRYNQRGNRVTLCRYRSV